MLPHINNGIQKRFLISIALTTLVLFAEVIGGLWTGSLALLSDSAHVFTDIFALLLSYLALRLSALPADDTHSFGYHRLEVIAALVNGISLAVISIGIFVEAFHRFQSPGQVRSTEMLIIAAIGLVANLLVAFVLGGGGHDHDDHPAHEKDLNVHSAFLHVLGDAASSVGVIVAGAIMSFTGVVWLDPAMSVVIGVMILVSSWRVLRSSLHILVEGVPEGISMKNVSQTILKTPGVAELHDLHVWNICSGHVALSAHVVLCQDVPVDQQNLMVDLKKQLSSGFDIDHTTIQLETLSCSENPSACRCK